MKRDEAGSIGFFDTLLEYYLPGLNVSSLDDDRYAAKIGWLKTIRKMESKDE